MAGKWEEGFQEFIESFKKKKEARGGGCTVHLVQFSRFIDSENEENERERIIFTGRPPFTNYFLFVISLILLKSRK